MNDKQKQHAESLIEALHEIKPMFYHFDPADGTVNCAYCGAGSTGFGIWDLPHQEYCPVKRMMNSARRLENALDKAEGNNGQ